MNDEEGATPTTSLSIETLSSSSPPSPPHQGIREKAFIIKKKLKTYLATPEHRQIIVELLLVFIFSMLIFCSFIIIFFWEIFNTISQFGKY